MTVRVSPALALSRADSQLLQVLVETAFIFKGDEVMAKGLGQVYTARAAEPFNGEYLKGSSHAWQLAR